MALSRKAQQDIAGHINSIQVWTATKEVDRARGDQAGFALSIRRIKASTLYLGDTYGIILPSYYSYHEERRHSGCYDSI
jgi:hypothetical protein